MNQDHFVRYISDYYVLKVEYLEDGFYAPNELSKVTTQDENWQPNQEYVKDYTIEELNSNLYIQSQLIKIDNNCYLLDSLGLLYSNDKSGSIIGRKVKDEIHWYTSV